MDGLIMKIWRKESAIASIKKQPYYGSWFQNLSYRDGVQWKVRMPKHYGGIKLLSEDKL